MPPSESILCVTDPGYTSGIVVYDTVTSHFEAYEMKFTETSRLMMSLASEHGSRLILIAESFRITAQTPKNTQAPWSLELIGVARAVSYIWCGRDLSLQDPASAKRFSSDARLKHMGWYTPKEGHANDAARHLLLALATRGWLSQDTLRELSEI